MAHVKTPIERVRQLVDAGACVGDAIRIVLGGSIPKWAATKGLHRTPASMTIYGRRVPPDTATLTALIEDLDVSEDVVRHLLLDATKEAAEAAAV